MACCYATSCLLLARDEEEAVSSEAREEETDKLEDSGDDGHTIHASDDAVDQVKGQQRGDTNGYNRWLAV